MVGYKTFRHLESHIYSALLFMLLIIISHSSNNFSKMSICKTVWEYVRSLARTKSTFTDAHMMKHSVIHIINVCVVSCKTSLVGWRADQYNVHGNGVTEQ